MSYQCQQCGHHQMGNSADNVCPLCRPPTNLQPTGHSERLRCTACGHAFDAVGTAPQVECPQCGVFSQRISMRGALPNAPKQYPAPVNPFQPTLVKKE